MAQELYKYSDKHIFIETMSNSKLEHWAYAFFMVIVAIALLSLFNYLKKSKKVIEFLNLIKTNKKFKNLFFTTFISVFIIYALLK